ncbi:efflux RND transporter periplasmic adaptor subunit [Immundisolibacter sp.]|uniref:efflux RND transporter periplasmic adaptor subunit n=1 Tax=Immundisolibacter sp. TaxID=1934948 RepID=UPI00262DBE57|nr:efflux RND transporter periplasmic adaptor subunit [Immundisolibacter sp.]MDD3650546.1 efflux RND transporter periplasmic adaptor subunit [Immundisolibacter sp.]
MTLEIHLRMAAAAALATALLLTACSAPQTPAPPPRPVRAVQASATPGRLDTHSYAARIEARHETVLAFEVGGRVAARLTEVGDRVGAGAPLARLDDTDLRLRVQDLSARLAAARAEQADAAVALQRARELRPKGFVSQADFDRATYRDQAAAAQTDALVAQLDLARRQLAYATLKAPMAGVITARALEVGQVVAAGQAAFTLARTDELEAVFDLPEQQVADLPEGVSVTLWTQPGEPLTARVREVAPQAAGDSRTYRVRATLQPGGVQPALGMSATVAFAAPTAMLAVPAGAVIKRDDGQAAVWVVDGEQAARLRPVTLGPVQGDQVTIASGLDAGEWVVTAGVHDLRDGQRVTLP